MECTALPRKGNQVVFSRTVVTHRILHSFNSVKVFLFFSFFY